MTGPTSSYPKLVISAPYRRFLAVVSIAAFCFGNYLIWRHGVAPHRMKIVAIGLVGMIFAARPTSRISFAVSGLNAFVCLSFDALYALSQNGKIDRLELFPAGLGVLLGLVGLLCAVFSRIAGRESAEDAPEPPRQS